MNNKLVFEPTTVTEYTWKKYQLLADNTYYWGKYNAVANIVRTHYWEKHNLATNGEYLYKKSRESLTDTYSFSWARYEALPVYRHYLSAYNAQKVRFDVSLKTYSLGTKYSWGKYNIQANYNKTWRRYTTGQGYVWRAYSRSPISQQSLYSVVSSNAKVTNSNYTTQNISGQSVYTPYGGLTGLHLGNTDVYFWKGMPSFSTSGRVNVETGTDRYVYQYLGPDNPRSHGYYLTTEYIQGRYEAGYRFLYINGELLGLLPTTTATYTTTGSPSIVDATTQIQHCIKYEYEQGGKVGTFISHNLSDLIDNNYTVVGETDNLNDYYLYDVYSTDSNAYPDIGTQYNIYYIRKYTTIQNNAYISYVDSIQDATNAYEERHVYNSLYYVLDSQTFINNTRGSFIETVFDVNENAYPADAIQGDYWYVYAGSTAAGKGEYIGDTVGTHTVFYTNNYRMLEENKTFSSYSDYTASLALASPTTTPFPQEGQQGSLYIEYVGAIANIIGYYPYQQDINYFFDSDTTGIEPLGANYFDSSRVGEVVYVKRNSTTSGPAITPFTFTGVTNSSVAQRITTTLTSNNSSYRIASLAPARRINDPTNPLLTKELNLIYHSEIVGYRKGAYIDQVQGTAQFSTETGLEPTMTWPNTYPNGGYQSGYWYERFDSSRTDRSYGDLANWTISTMGPDYVYVQNSGLNGNHYTQQLQAGGYNHYKLVYVGAQTVAYLYKFRYMNSGSYFYTFNPRTVVGIDNPVANQTYNVGNSSGLSEYVYSSVPIKFYQMINNGDQLDPQVIGEVSSTDRNAYPDSGAQGGYGYVYSHYIDTTQGYTKGTYITDVSSANRNAYPDDAYFSGFYYQFNRATTSYSKGNYIGTVTGQSITDFPENDYIQNDYWYVYESSAEVVRAQFTIDDTMISGGVNYTQRINKENDNLVIGSASASSINFEVLAPASVYQGYLQKSFTYYVKQPNDSDWRQIGIYTLTKCNVATEHSAYITGYDNISKFDIDVDAWIASLTFPITLGAMFESLCEYCGVEPFSTTFVNSGYSVKDNFVGIKITGRTILQYIAECAGGFVIATANGEIRIKNYEAKNINLSNSQYTDEVHELYFTPVITSLIARAKQDDVGVESTEEDYVALSQIRLITTSNITNNQFNPNEDYEVVNNQLVMPR